MSDPPPSLAPLPESVLRAIVEQASDGIFITDGTLRIEWVNQAARTMLGQSSEAMVGRFIADLVEPDDLAAAPLRSGELRAGVPTRTVRRFRTSTGAIRLLEVSATAIGDGRMLGIARDVTDRHAQERLTRTEESFRRLIEASPDAVIVHRAARICYLNTAAVRILGLADVDAGVGLHILDVVHPDDRAWARRKISTLDQEGTSTPFTDMRFLRGDGQTIVLSVGGVRVVFEGEPSIVAVARDVSDQRRLQLQLAQADRMASLGTLAAGVGHEINNPLAYVMLSLEAITRLAARAEPELGRLVAEHAASAFDGARRVAKIVRDLRAFSRLDEDVRAVVDVRRALEIALSTASHELKHRARVTTALDQPAAVVASEGRLAQIFLNLLVNAAQAIPEGHPGEHEIRASVWCEGADVIIAIADTGVGIAEADRGHLFEPFFTTKPIGEGSGLGLAICHGLVTALGGRIRVESTVGQGSTFFVVLPRAETSTATAAAPAVVRAAAPPRARILVVDDEPQICEAIARVLGDHHDVVTALSAVDARALLARAPGFDVILCDVVMPDLTGADLHEWLLDHDRELAARMLFITGGREGSAARALVGIEAWRWLEKPFAIEPLEHAVDQMLAASAARRTAG